jgi:23S rRNA (cytosine1962-C5)-methyltransferase
MFKVSYLSERFDSMQHALGLGTNCFRWCDEASVAIDRFDSVAIINRYQHYSETEEALLAERLLETKCCTSVYVKRRPKEAKHLANTQLAHLAPALPLAGPPVESLLVREHEMQFEIRPANGLSVGLYLDARSLRAQVRAKAKAKKVLNTFAYTCGFGVAAALGGAASVLNIDTSKKVLEWGRANFAHNEIAEPMCWARDVEASCLALNKKAERFSLAVLDPPGFATTPEGRFSLQTDYHRLVTSVAALLAPQAELLVMCNVASMSMNDLRRHVQRGMAARLHQATEARQDAVDFSFTHGLKALWVKVD